MRHDLRLSAKVVRGARGISTGRHAVRELSLRDLRELARRYGEEYGSRLFALRDLGRLLPRPTRRRSDRGPVRSDGVPLFFPNRVTVWLANGDRDEERVDLPVGSLASSEVDAALEGKVRSSLGRTMGAQRAGEALAAGLDAERFTLDELVRRLSA